MGLTIGVAVELEKYKTIEEQFKNFQGEYEPIKIDWGTSENKEKNMTSFTEEEIKEIQAFPAIDVVMETFAACIGDLTKEIVDEESKAKPNKLKLMTLEAEIDRLDTERNDLLNPDCVSIGRARYIYAPILKAQFQAFKARKMDESLLQYDELYKKLAE